MKYPAFSKVKVLVALIGLISVGGLAGCSSLSESYPSVANIKRVTEKLLTPYERKKAIEDMSLENAKQRETAVEKIEKR